MKRITALFLTILMVSAFLPGCTDDKYPENGRMDKLVRDIHHDLKRLSRKDNWLTSYKDKCFYENHIFYMPPQIKTDRGSPAMPDQISIGYHPIGMKKEGKYLNHLAEEKSSYFSTLGFQVGAVLILRNEKDAKLKEKIKQVITFRCRALHNELNK